MAALPLFPYSRRGTLWSDKNVCSACCKRYKNKSLPSSERSTLSAANNSGLSMRYSGNPIYFLSNLFVNMQHPYLFTSYTFLKRLDSSLSSKIPGQIWNQTKVAIGNSLEMFCSFNYTNAQID